MDNQNPYGAPGGGGYGASGYGSPGAGGGGAPPVSPIVGVLDVQDVLSTTFRTIQSALVPIMGCALVVTVPTLITMFVIRVIMYLVMFSGSNGGPPDMEAIQRGALVGGLAYFVGLAVLLVGHAIGQGGIMYAVAEQLSGRKPSLGQAIRVGLGRSLPVIGVSLIVGIIVMIGTMMCFVPGIIALVFLCVAVPACVVERVGPIDSISRSVALTEGNRLTIFLIGLALTLGLMVVSCCIVGPAMGIVTVGTAATATPGDIQSFQEMQNPLSWQQLLVFVAEIPMLILQVMAQTTCIAVIYARLRGLRDGVDAQAIASVFA